MGATSCTRPAPSTREKSAASSTATRRRKKWRADRVRRTLDGKSSDVESAIAQTYRIVLDGETRIAKCLEHLIVREKPEVMHFALVARAGGVGDLVIEQQPRVAGVSLDARDSADADAVRLCDVRRDARRIEDARRHPRFDQQHAPG